MTPHPTAAPRTPQGDAPAIDPEPPGDALAGLSSAEAAKRLATHGENVLTQRADRAWVRQLLAQFTHPLALLLAAAAILAVVAALTPLAIAIALVIVLNAGLAFWQERQAVHALAALGDLLPTTALVVRDGAHVEIEARLLVPGDVMVIAEGDRICADARLISGALDCDMSALTGESATVLRAAGHRPTVGGAIEQPDRVFSGTNATGGEAVGVVLRTGMGTELGRVATMSQEVEVSQSPLQEQVRGVAWLIAGVAVVIGLAFIPLGTLVAGLTLQDATVFAIGLLVANVPEGLLPTITLALAVGVRALASRGALVKELSGVETLGATDVICTDKTGTLTQNRMRVVDGWTLVGDEAARLAALRAAALCTTAELATRHGDPMELAILDAATVSAVAPDHSAAAAARLQLFRFDPVERRMTTVDDGTLGRIDAHVKGAPDAVLARCASIQDSGGPVPLTATLADEVRSAERALGEQGLRVIAVARRTLDHVPGPDDRAFVECELTLLGLVAFLDPPREEVKDAVARCHSAGVRIHVVTGDAGATASNIAGRVGIGDLGSRVIEGPELDAMSDDAVADALDQAHEVIFARTAPEAKLRIAGVLHDRGHVIAMTGDGVNDAPALRRADIGVAMGQSGTEVARQAATMILTTDDFSTIVDAIEEGRRVYANIRKFILYIFAHAPAEVVPFLVFALSGGAIPLPLTALQILAIDLGTETLPALALGREPIEQGTMERPPRRRDARVIDGALLRRAWGVLGLTSAALVLAGFLFQLLHAGWTPSDPTGSGTALHHAYLQATSMTFLGIVACQIGTALASRTEHASLRSVGVFTNPLLLWGIAFELVVAFAVVWWAPLQGVFQTRPPDAICLLILPVFPVIVWGCDELYRWRLRAR